MVEGEGVLGGEVMDLDKNTPSTVFNAFKVFVSNSHSHIQQYLKKKKSPLKYSCKNRSSAVYF